MSFHKELCIQYMDAYLIWCDLFSLIEDSSLLQACHFIYLFYIQYGQLFHFLCVRIITLVNNKYGAFTFPV